MTSVDPKLLREGAQVVLQLADAIEQNDEQLQPLLLLKLLIITTQLRSIPLTKEHKDANPQSGA